MHRILYFLWFLLSINIVVAQGNIKLDSLKSIWENPVLPSEERLAAILELADSFEEPKIDRSLHYHLKGLQIAEEVRNDTFQLKFLFASGTDYRKLGELEKSKSAYQSYINQALKIKRLNLISVALEHLSSLHSTTDSLDKFDAYLDTIFPQIENRIKNKVERAKLYKAASIGYTNSAKFAKALFWILKAETLLKQLPGHTSEKATIYHYTAYIYGTLKNFPKAEKYAREAVKYAKNLEDRRILGMSFMALNQISLGSKKYEDALIYADSCLHCFKEFNPNLDYHNINIIRADALNSMNQPNEAIPILLKSLNALEKAVITSEANIWISYACSELAEGFLQLEQYRKAEYYGNKALGYAKGLQLETMASYEVLYKAWEALGDYEKSLEAYKAFIVYRDSIEGERNIAIITRLELENQFQQERFADSLAIAQQTLSRELEFQSALNEQKANRNIGIGAGIAALLLALGLFYRLRHIRKTKAVLEEKNQMIEAEKEKAQSSEKAKQQFLANMSHEIRTPMNAIKGMTDILLRRTPKNQQLTYLNAIKESSNSLLVIINDILDISKIEAGKIDLEAIPFSIAEVIQNVKMISQFKAEEKGLLLQTDIEESSITSIQGDPTRLHQVLVNLVGNAIKFTEKGVVTIQIKTELPENQNQVLAHFCVSDTGVGIGTDRLGKIFESFEQAYSDTTRKFGGTGLGLSISKKLVELQGGKIWAESQKGKGSQFYFSIPYEITEEVVEVEATPLAKAEVPNLQGIKILLVEDNEFNAIVAREELEDAIEAVDVEVAENGVIAIEKVIHGDFDIILMDVQMPVMNGYEATQAIRNSSNGKSKTPIIAMTANVMKEEVERCFEMGMDDFIGKPFNTEQLLSKIQKLLLETQPK